MKKRLRRLGLVLTVAAAVFLTFGAIYIWNFFTEPFASASSTFQGGASWDGETPFHLLWLDVSGGFALLSLNPTQQSFTVVNLPLGEGKLYQGEDGLNLAAEEALRLLGVPVDGYLLVGEEGVSQLRSLFPEAAGVKDFIKLGSILQLPAVWGVARENLRTDLDIPEILQVLWYLFRVRSDRVNLVSPSPGLFADPKALDLELSLFFRDEKIVAEHLKIQVLNGSGKPGRAASAARIIRNFGGEVIRTDNFERQDLVKGYLLLESSGSYTARRLAEIFDVSDSRPPRMGSEARAEITLILGREDAHSAS